MASFWTELRRRNVVRVAIAYSAAVWALLQVADLVLSNLGAPAWIIQMLIVAAALGFPVALVLAWLFEITPDGIRAAADVPAGGERRFSVRQINHAIIALLIVAVSFLVVDNYLWVDAPREPSIAILPFTNLSATGDDSAEFFSIGMHDALLTQLAKLGGIKVISRTSVLEYADRGKSAPEIAAELGVATIMEATVLRSGNRLQINAQLINGVTDGHLWGEIFERELTAENVFAVQREMATSIASILRATLTPAEQTVLAQVPTQSERALQLFFTGNEFARRPNERDSMPIAVARFQQAVDEDPTFMAAWAALARAHVELYGMGGDRGADRALSAMRALERARALAPDAPEVHIAAGMYQMFVEQNIDSAITELEAALVGSPGSADLFNVLSSSYRRAGRYEDSVAYRIRAMELDPRNVDALLSLGAGTYARMHDYDAAAATLERALAIAPDSAMLHWAKAMVPYWRDGDVTAMRALSADPPVDLGRFGVRAGVLAAVYSRDYSAALAILENLRPGIVNNRNRLLWLGQAYRFTGQDESAARSFEELRQVTGTALARDPDDIGSHLYRGAALAGLGQNDAAIAAGRTVLELAVDIVDADQVEDIRGDVVTMIFAPVGAVDLAVQTLEALLSNRGVFSIEGLLPDPSLDPIRDDPRFAALVARFARSSEADDSPASASRRLPFVIPSPLTAASYFVQGGVNDVD